VRELVGEEGGHGGGGFGLARRCGWTQRLPALVGWCALLCLGWVGACAYAYALLCSAGLISTPPMVFFSLRKKNTSNLFGRRRKLFGQTLGSHKNGLVVVRIGPNVAAPKSTSPAMASFINDGIDELPRTTFHPFNDYDPNSAAVGYGSYSSFPDGPRSATHPRGHSPSPFSPDLKPNNGDGGSILPSPIEMWEEGIVLSFFHSFFSPNLKPCFSFFEENVCCAQRIIVLSAPFKFRSIISHLIRSNDLCLFFHSSPPTFPFRFLLFRLDVEGGGGMQKVTRHWI
jgi:hypothetical protein